ncbi:Twitching motility protein PilT [Minicystis rosea]|nr:Twitching motility protein PilT [Minicystis rosea]
MSSPYASEVFLHRLLGKALAAGASDVHLRVGQPPGARVRGDLVYFRGDKILAADTLAAARLLVGPAGEARLDAAHEVVFVYEASGVGRFRVTAYRQRGDLALVMRALPVKIPTFAELGVPAAVTALAETKQGILIVAGGTGQGKTTTLAAMVGHLNDSYPRHIVTLEEPIELWHEDHRGSVSQRSIGEDAVSFASGVRAARWLDPDVIVISDLRDHDTFAAALEAAECGHLIIAAVAAPDVTRAVGRLQALGRGVHDLAPRLAASLAGVLAQRLVVKRDGSGVALCSEVLVATAAVREALRTPEGSDELATQLRELMEKGASPYGMQTFEMSHKQLVSQGVASASLRPPA